MAKNNNLTRWAVRVELNKHDSDSCGLLLENLRYAGILSYDKDEATGKITFYLYPPKGVNPEVWATQNSQRMRSFMLSATPIDFGKQ